jgi:hypothetical protein
MFIDRLRRLVKDGSGQAMIAALVCLVLGGLIVTPLIGYTATGAKSVSLKTTSLLGRYAADAGLEEVLWALKYDQSLPTSLTAAINNGMQVTMNTVSRGFYIMVAGEWAPPDGPHSTELFITSTITWDDGAGAFKYTVTANYTGTGNCRITEVGVRLPVGYSYQTGSAALFGSNLSTTDPSDEPDGAGARILNWTFPKTLVDPIRTQEFYFTGSGNLEGNYAWVVGTREDVGTVGELSGDFYIITATATRNGASAGQIVADVMKSGSTVHIVSYRVTR